MTVSDEDALIEPAIGDCPRPREHDQKTEARGFDNFLRCADGGPSEEAVKRCGYDEHVKQGEQTARDVHEATDLPVCSPVHTQRRRGGKEHDDRSLDEQRNGKDQASVGREVDLRGGQPGNNKGNGGTLEAHQNPTGSQRPPSAEDLPCRQRSLG